MTPLSEKTQLWNCAYGFCSFIERSSVHFFKNPHRIWRIRSTVNDPATTLGRIILWSGRSDAGSSTTFPNVGSCVSLRPITWSSPACVPTAWPPSLCRRDPSWKWPHVLPQTWGKTPPWGNIPLWDLDRGCTCYTNVLEACQNIADLYQ